MFPPLIMNVEMQNLVLFKCKHHIGIKKNVLTMLWFAGVGAIMVRWRWSCIEGTLCKWLAVLIMNETAFLSLLFYVLYQ